MSPTASPPNSKERWTLEEWLQIEFEPRCEFEHGRLIPMASPTKRHQDLVLLTAYEVRRYAQARQLGTVLMEVDVALPTGKGVTPDVSFIIRERAAELIIEGKVQGVPDLVVEIISPSTRTRDTVHKLRDYHQAGVPWYWLIDSEALTIQELQWTPEGYVIRAMAEAGEVFRSHALEGFELNLQVLLAEWGRHEGGEGCPAAVAAGCIRTALPPSSRASLRWRLARP